MSQNRDNEIKGYIERITFQSEETGFTVARLKEVGRRDLTVIVGAMPSIQEGEVVVCKGSWKNDKNFGWQFQVNDYEVELPSTIAGIKKYLGSGMIKGIGNAFAERIVKYFGKDTLQVIDQSPDKLVEVDGIGKKRVAVIKSHWKDQRAIREVMMFLQSQGISPMYAQKIYKQYGDLAIAKVQANPYHLSKDIYGIGFKTADKIAQKLGILKDADERVDAGVEFVLFELSNRGHTCYPVIEFVEAAQKLLEVASERISNRLREIELNYRILIQKLTKDGREEDYIWLMGIYNAEKSIVTSLKKLLALPPAFQINEIESKLQQAEINLNILLASKQKMAVTSSLQSKIHIITGGPGTGKSTITKVILNLAQQHTQKILLAAPTGRAAKRLSQVTGLPAQTIHSLLEFDFAINGFRRNNSNPLDGELIIVDEASMIDTMLMFNFLKAIPYPAIVIFIGDIDQLPSVGAGNVLRDFIYSKQIPVTRLTEIFRQAAESKIITSAHRINEGKMPDLRVEKDSDFFFIEETEVENINATIRELVHKRLPNRYGFNAFDDIQVLSPMKRGIIGTHSLNESLQKTLNPSNEPLEKYGRRFHKLDKVMQMVNNYDKNVFNGDVGRIVVIDRDEELLTVKFDKELVEYDFSEIDQLVLAYAVSVHKYQGSECPCIVIPVHTTHYTLLFKNLIYTGITRGKKLVVLIGTKKALAIALRNNQASKRHTGLRHVLEEEIGNGVAPALGLLGKQVEILDWKTEMDVISNA
ncbi:MAG: ATP-dependent RecD-like DNA helicase [Saprospiraceae bacterium]